jgi:hypothetical protein
MDAVYFGWWFAQIFVRDAWISDDVLNKRISFSGITFILFWKPKWGIIFDWECMNGSGSFEVISVFQEKHIRANWRWSFLMVMVAKITNNFTDTVKATL